MEFESLVTALTANSGETLISFLRAAHLVGLATGLGAATLMELMILGTAATGKVTNEKVSLVRFASRFVHTGLLVLWVSGAAIIGLHYLGDVQFMTNQALVAKLIIVCILSINCVFVHETVLPLFQHQAGRGGYDGFTGGEKLLFATSVAISAVSWYVPLIIAATHSFDKIVEAKTILAAYALLLLIATVITATAVRMMRPRRRPVRLNLRNYAMIEPAIPTYRPVQISVPVHPSRVSSRVSQRQMR